MIGSEDHFVGILSMTQGKLVTKVQSKFGYCTDEWQQLRIKILYHLLPLISKFISLQ